MVSVCLYQPILENTMNEEQKATLQVIWEQLNGALYDLTEGDMGDAIPTVEDCIARLEAMGVHEGEQP
jgi:hypothetical protein